MLITCKCLNVSVSVKGDSIQNIDVSTLDLSPNEQNDPFFKEGLGTVDLVRISKEQPSLVQIRNIGNWIVHCCLNCSVDSHAINRERGASFVLVSSKMVVDPSQVTALQSSVLYSPVFRIVVNSTDETSLTETKLSAPHMPSSIQAALSALQQQLHESLQRVALEVEERVRSFSDEQYAILDDFRRRAHDDHRTLAKLLFEKFEGEDKSTLGSTLRTPPAFLDGNEAPSLPPPPELKRPADLVKDQFETTAESRSPALSSSSADSSRAGSARSPGGRSAPIKMNRSMRGSLDAEGLFPLEGMDKNVDIDVVSDEDLDIEDSVPTEVMSRSRNEIADAAGNSDYEGRRGSLHIARSLPVTVPGFGRSGRERRSHCHAGDTEVEEPENIEGLGMQFSSNSASVPPEDPMYIAASIKALARSVYGDAPFGDLPRPRFSSQI